MGVSLKSVAEDTPDGMFSVRKIDEVKEGILNAESPLLL
jgi:hypothetical protein